MAQPLDRCPNCRVLLSGVECASCGYIGGKSEFINNNHRCPKCQSYVRINGTRTASRKPIIPGRKWALTGLISAIVFAVLWVIMSIAVAPGFLCISWLMPILIIALNIWVARKANNSQYKKMANIGLIITVVCLVLDIIISYLIL